LHPFSTSPSPRFLSPGELSLYSCSSAQPGSPSRRPSSHLRPQRQRRRKNTGSSCSTQLDSSMFAVRVDSLSLPSIRDRASAPLLSRSSGHLCTDSRHLTSQLMRYLTLSQRPACRARNQQLLSCEKMCCWRGNIRPTHIPRARLQLCCFDETYCEHVSRDGGSCRQPGAC
jgi:hypothetical protein